MSKSVGTCAGWRRCSTRSAATRCPCLSEGHYRQPTAFTPEKLADAARRVEGIRNAGGGLVPGPSPAVLVWHREVFFDALADDYDSRARRGARRVDREVNVADGPVGDADAREMLAVPGSKGPGPDRRGGRAGEVVEPASGAARAVRRATSAEADRLAGRAGPGPGGPRRSRGCRAVPIGP